MTEQMHITFISLPAWVHVPIWAGGELILSSFVTVVIVGEFYGLIVTAPGAQPPGPQRGARRFVGCFACRRGGVGCFRHADAVALGLLCSAALLQGAGP